MLLTNPPDGEKRTRIKFCGMTRAEDVRVAVALGVDAIGLIFARRSPRRIDLDRALALRDAVSSRVSVVALVMDNATDEVAAIVEHLRPHLLQFHGSEDDAFCTGFGLPFLKALPMRDVGANAVPAMLARYPSAAGFVLDGHSAGGAGGSGERFDWAVIPQQRPGRPWLLAGGLDAATVGAAIRSLRPWGVDVASGIEAAPGVKDHERMRALVAAVRGADGEREQASQESHEQR
jgi:phosphoribosylanthranilate isomerase